VRARRDQAIALATVLAAAAPLVLRGGDLWTSGAETLLLLLAAMGLNVAMGYAGQPSLGQGGFVALGAYTAAILIVRHGWEPPAAVLFAVALSAIAGGLVARGVARLRPPFVALATWLFAWATAFAVTAFPGLTGGASGISIGQTSLDMRALGVHWRLSSVAFYEIALVLIAVALILHTTLIRRFGPAFAAVRTDASAARSAGIPVDRIRFGALTGSALVGGLAGALLALNARVADPTSYGPLLSVKLFVVVLLGGAARRLGPAVGLVGFVVISALGSAYASAAGASTATVEPLAAAAVLGAILVFGTDGLIPVIDRPKPSHLANARASTPEPLPSINGGHLAASGVGVSFGGIVALDDVSIDMRRGTCHAIVGPNGSGKTTLLRVLAGATTPDRGSVLIDDRVLTTGGPFERARAGIARTLQRNVIQPRTTALDYVLAGVETVGRVGPVRAALRSPEARREEHLAYERAERALAAVGLTEFASAQTESLTGAAQRLLQIARALAPGPRVLLLDEPSAGFGRESETHLRAIIDSLRASGLTIVIVEHNLRLVRALADRVSVLDAGRLIAEGTADEVSADPAVRAAYLGAERDRIGARAPVDQKETAPRGGRPRAPRGGMRGNVTAAAGRNRGDRGERAARPSRPRRTTDRSRSAARGGAAQRGGRGKGR